MNKQAASLRFTEEPCNSLAGTGGVKLLYSRPLLCVSVLHDVQHSLYSAHRIHAQGTPKEARYNMSIYRQLNRF